MSLVLKNPVEKPDSHVAILCLTPGSGTSLELSAKADL